MKNKLFHVVFDNLGLKILAAIFSVILWLVVVNVDNPVQTKSFTVMVKVTGEETLAEQGKYYTIPDNANTVTFRVSARRTIMEQLNSTDFSAEANLADLENDTRIPISITANRFTGSVTVLGSTKYIYVDIGEQMTSKFIVSGEVKGEVPSGYKVESIEVTPNVLSIRGPGETVSQIGSVVAYCDVSKATSSVTESVVPTVLDTEGNEMDTTGLEISETTVSVSVRWANTKSVPIVLESMETGEGVTLNKVTITPAQLEIIGDANVLNSVTQIVIPKTAIDVSQLNADIETEVDVASYLPEGVSVESSTSTKVTVLVDVSVTKSATFDVPASNITITGLDDSLSASISGSTIKTTITGEESALSSLKADHITGTIDASKITEAGTYSVTVKFAVDGEFSTSDAIASVVVTSAKKNSSNTQD